MHIDDEQICEMTFHGGMTIQAHRLARQGQIDIFNTSCVFASIFSKCDFLNTLEKEIADRLKTPTETYTLKILDYQFLSRKLSKKIPQIVSLTTNIPRITLNNANFQTFMQNDNVPSK